MKLPEKAPHTLADLPGFLGHDEAYWLRKANQRWFEHRRVGREVRLTDTQLGALIDKATRLEALTEHPLYAQLTPRSRAYHDNKKPAARPLAAHRKPSP